MRKILQTLNKEGFTFSYAWRRRCPDSSARISQTWSFRPRSIVPRSLLSLATHPLIAPTTPTPMGMPTPASRARGRWQREGSGWVFYKWRAFLYSIIIRGKAEWVFIREGGERREGKKKGKILREQERKGEGLWLQLLQGVKWFYFTGMSLYYFWSIVAVQRGRVWTLWESAPNPSCPPTTSKTVHLQIQL